MHYIVKWVRENWILAILLLAVFSGLCLTYRESHVSATKQAEFNLRTCQKGVELRNQGNQIARTVNSLKASTYTIMTAAANESGDPPTARARYEALADQIRALPDVDELPPTDCPAIVKLYTPIP